MAEDQRHGTGRNGSSSAGVELERPPERRPADRLRLESHQTRSDKKVIVYLWFKVRVSREKRASCLRELEADFQEERRGSKCEGKACEGGVGGERGEAPPASNRKMDGCDGKQRGEGRLEPQVA